MPVDPATEKTAEVSSGVIDDLPVGIRHRQTHPASIPLRVKFFITGVLFPIVCFLAPFFGLDATFDEPWQSGRIVDYLAMLLAWPGYAPVLPIIGYSMICLSTVADSTGHVAVSLGSRWLVRRHLVGNAVSDLLVLRQWNHDAVGSDHCRTAAVVGRLGV